MIRAEHIKKKFQDTVIFDDFNYEFNSCGFYLLFGPSGCGKTTLLNMIAKIWEPDDGVFLTEFNSIAYITQDCYFVDYLDVLDNLKLCTDREELIIEQLKKLGLAKCIHQYPRSLSGGEKQRLAVARARMLETEVLLLDEPTAALDEINSLIMFETLKKLKKECLIICVSHDNRAKEHCDEWIDFTRLYLYTSSIKKEYTEKKIQIIESFNKYKLYPFIKKQNTYYKENKRVSVFLILLFSLVMLMFGLLTNVEEKLISNLGEDNKINASTITCDIDFIEECLEGIGEDVVDIVYPYASAATYYEDELSEQKPGEIASISIPYQDTLSAITLPQKESNFRLSENLLYGTYPKKINEVALSFDLAEKIAKETTYTMEELISASIPIITAHGEEPFIVSGIFNLFTDHDDIYLRTIGSTKDTANETYFFTNEYAMSYMQDDKDSREEKEGHVRLTYYFDSFEKTLQFEEVYQNSNIQIRELNSYFSKVISLFRGIEFIFVPILLFLSMITLLFYVFIRNVQIKYAKHIYSVYEMCGYSLSNIRKSTLQFYMVHITILFMISMSINYILGYIINIMSEHMDLFPFRPYREEIVFTSFLYLVTFIITVLFVCIQFKSYRHVNAYDMLRERRDLL